MRNRWVALGAGILIQTILGGIYAWSTFVPSLIQSHGITTGQCGFIFGLTIAVFTVTMIFAGRVLAAKGYFVAAGICAVLFMGGYLLASVSKGSYLMLLLSIGGLVGAGIGFGYVCPLSAGMRWFPEKKGLVTGVAVAGFGGGAIILSSVAEHFLLSGMEVLVFFRWLGIFTGLFLFVAALLLSDPPSLEKVSKKEHGISTILTLPFGIITLGMFSGTFAGLLIIGNLTPLVIMAGLTVGQAVVAVSIFAVGNALGRIVWGQVFDLLGYKSIPLSLGIFAVLCLLLLAPLSIWLLLTSIGLLGFGFGANFVIYASAISRYYGIESFSKLYPICFLAYGLAGIIGPGVGGILADYTGSYGLALCISSVFTALVGILSFSKLHALDLDS